MLALCRKICRIFTSLSFWISTYNVDWESQKNFILNMIIILYRYIHTYAYISNFAHFLYIIHVCLYVWVRRIRLKCAILLIYSLHTTHSIILRVLVQWHIPKLTNIWLVRKFIYIHTYISFLALPLYVCMRLHNKSVRMCKMVYIKKKMIIWVYSRHRIVHEAFPRSSSQFFFVLWWCAYFAQYINKVEILKKKTHIIF